MMPSASTPGSGAGQNGGQPSVQDDAAGPRPGAGGQPVPARLSGLPPPIRLLLVLLALLFCWYAVLGGILGGIHVNSGLRPSGQQLPTGGSVSIGMAAALLQNQVEERSFTPNDPIFYPTGLARRTPAFQSAIIETVGAAVVAINSQGDAPALREATHQLGTPVDQWWLRPGWPPAGLPAEHHYRTARRALELHNAAIASAPRVPATQRLAPASREALGALLDRIEAEAERGDLVIKAQGGERPAVRLAAARGTAHAAAMLLRGIREDNALAVRQSGRAARWGAALDALDTAAALDPLLSGRDDLIVMGYQLLIASQALRDILGEQA